METLAQESPKYLYGNPGSSVNDPLWHLGDSAVEPRPRSDSSSSNMSNASSGSASSRPAFHTSHSFSNVPGYRGPITVSDEGSPTSAPVRPSDLNQFITRHGGTQTTIPHINCNNNFRIGVEGHKVNPGSCIGHLPSGNSPTQPAKPGLRPIEVQHVQSHADQAENPSQPQIYVHQIRIDRGQGSAVPTAGNQVTTDRSGWSYHQINLYKPCHNTHFQNNPQNSAFSPDLQLPVTRFENMNLTPSVSSLYKSPTEDYDQAYGAPKYNHSSQTHIYLNPVVSTNPQTSLKSPNMERTIHPALPSSLPVTNSAVSDHRVFQSFARQRSDKTHDLSNSQSPLGRKPIVVEISARREGGVQSQIQFFNEIADSNSSGHSVLTHGSVIDPSGQSSDNISAGEQGKTVINIKGVSPSHEEGGFLKFPPMPNVCVVPEHSPGPGHSSSSDSESVFHTERDYRPRPFLSPSSSHSSVSSESSTVLVPSRQQSRPGLNGDPEEYTQGSCFD